jgi:hypothetical protein
MILVCGVGYVATLRGLAACAVAKYQVDGVVGVESGVASLPSELRSLVARKLLMYAPDKATTYRQLQVHIRPCISLFIFIIYYSFLIFIGFFVQCSAALGLCRLLLRTSGVIGNDFELIGTTPEWSTVFKREGTDVWTTEQPPGQQPKRDSRMMFQRASWG